MTPDLGSIVQPGLAVPRHLALFAGLALLSGIVVRVMIAVGVPDRPDAGAPGARKAHTRTTPKSGGVGIVAAFLVGVLLLYRYGQVSRLPEPYFLGVIGASVLIAAVALADDLFDFRFVVKLATQLLAAAAAMVCGLSVHVVAFPWVGAVDLHWLGVALSLGFILLVTNAMNFIDGLNGLAAGVTFIACLFLAGIAALHGGFFVYTAGLLLAGSVLGFLPFNFPRGRIFMGDVGSQFCGFVLALLGIAAARYQGAPLSFLMVPLMLSGVLFDVIFTLIRRAANGENIARAHRGHLYQVAFRAGMDARLVALAHWGFAAIGGLVAIADMAAGAAYKLPVACLVLAPQALWLAHVATRARRAGVGRWSA